MSVALGPTMSIHDDMYVGKAANGSAVYMPIAYRNALLCGEPGSGKSTLLNNLIAQSALCSDTRMVGFDAKLVELGPWRDVLDVRVGPDMEHALVTLIRLQAMMDQRYAWMDANAIRKLTSEYDMPFYVVVLDEIAYYATVAGTKAQQELFCALLRDVVARGRAAGVIVLAATQRASYDIIPTSLRDLFAWRFTGRATTPGSSDVALGHGWADRGYNAMDLDAKKPGEGFLLAENGTPQKIRCAYLSDEDVARVSAYAAQLRSSGFAQAA